jgi:hypothetical protein
MTLSLINDIAFDQKVNARLLILDLQFYPYSGGTRTRILAHDEMKTKIEIVGFDNVHEMCQQLSIGNTFVFSNVICSTYNDKLQLKLSSFSTINTSTVELEGSKLTIQEMKNLPQDENVNIFAVVEESSPEVSTNPRTSSRTRRYTIADPTGSVSVYAINGASEEAIPEGSIISCRGKIGNNQSLVIFSPMSIVENEELKTWWNNNSDCSNKRKKPNFTMIGNITVNDIGEKVDIAGIIHSTSLGVTTTQSGSTKRTIHIVDPSCKSIEMTIFGDAAKNDYVIGSEIVCKATISDWNKFSLMMNSNIVGFEKIPVNKYKSMLDWWNIEGKYADITCISSSELPRECTIAEAIESTIADERLLLKGDVNNGVLTDSSGSIKLESHSSVMTDTTTFKGNVVIRNAYVRKTPNGKCLVVFRNSVKQNTGMDQFVTMQRVNDTVNEPVKNDTDIVPSLISGIVPDMSNQHEDD